MNDKSKVKEIKGKLEVEFSAIKANGKGEYLDKTLTKETETSVSVDWRGGGQLKQSRKGFIFLS